MKRLQIDPAKATLEYNDLTLTIHKRQQREDGHLLSDVLVPEEDYPIIAAGHRNVTGEDAAAGFFWRGVQVKPAKVHAMEAHYAGGAE